MNSDKIIRTTNHEPRTTNHEPRTTNHEPRLNLSKIFWPFIFVVSVLMFLVLYYFAGQASFWLDELYTIGSIRSGWSLSDTIKYYINDDKASPLFFCIAYFWYRIVPHTEQALLSLCIIFTTLTSIMMGIIGRRLHGVRCGIFAFIFTICNTSIISAASYEFRPYSLLLFFVSLNIYFYLLRLKNENWKNIILYGITMCLLPYTHYVSVLLCFGFFLADCFLILRKRTSIRVIASYFIGALLFLPWLLLLLPNIGTFAKFWPGVPSLYTVFRIVFLFCVGISTFYAFTFWMAIYGMITIIGKLLRCKTDKKEPPTEIVFIMSGLSACAFMVLVVYIYSVFINPEGSFFVPRYFLPLTLFSVLLISYGADNLYTSISPASKRKAMLFFVCFLLFVIVDESSHASRNIAFHAEKEITNLIHEYEKEQKKSIILVTNNDSPRVGWEEFYLTADHTREAPPSLLVKDTDTLSKLQSGLYERIYLCYLYLELELTSNSQLMNWLNENYTFSEQINNYKFQILTLKQ